MTDFRLPAKNEKGEKVRPKGREKGREAYSWKEGERRSLHFEDGTMGKKKGKDACTRSRDAGIVGENDAFLFKKRGYGSSLLPPPSCSVWFTYLDTPHHSVLLASSSGHKGDQNCQRASAGADQRVKASSEHFKCTSKLATSGFSRPEISASNRKK